MSLYIGNRRNSRTSKSTKRSAFYNTFTGTRCSRANNTALVDFADCKTKSSSNSSSDTDRSRSEKDSAEIRSYGVVINLLCLFTSSFEHIAIFTNVLLLIKRLLGLRFLDNSLVPGLHLGDNTLGLKRSSFKRLSYSALDKMSAASMSNF